MVLKRFAVKGFLGDLTEPWKPPGSDSCEHRWWKITFQRKEKFDTCDYRWAEVDSLMWCERCGKRRVPMAPNDFVSDELHEEYVVME